jgi:FkbM family methyltransferase
MRMADLERANRRARAEAAKVRPVTTSEVIRGHRKRFPFYGWVEIDPPYCPPYTVFCGNDDPVALDTFWNGRFGYEPGTLGTWARLAHRSRVVVDVGAHVGHFALTAALAAPAARVVAFEPVEHIFARLSLNQRVNGIRNLEALSVAVSDRDGWADIAVRFGPALLSTASTLEASDKRETRLRKVPVTSLDAHFAETPVDLMKIDVEGHEPSVLDGGREMLARDRPTLVLEILKSTPLPELLDVLDPIGYEGYWVSEDDGTLRPRAEARPPGSRNMVFRHGGSPLPAEPPPAATAKRRRPTLRRRPG